MARKTPAREAQSRPVFRELSETECDELLRRNHVGRIAYTFHDRVDVVPVHYVFADGWLYGRTSPSEKLVTLRHHQWIAFEVDEIRGLFDWQSVVVHSALYPITPDHPDWASALTILRRFIPDTLTADDPVPARTVLFRIPVEQRTGRAAESGG